MPNRSRKHLSDPMLNVLAIVEGETLVERPSMPLDGKDPAAVALGRKGGLIGGKARAAAMSPKQRSAAAKKAARARWAKKGPK